METRSRSEGRMSSEELHSVLNSTFSHIEHELESFKPDVKADEVGTVKSVGRELPGLRAYPVQNLKNFSALQEISWVPFLM